MIQGKEEYQMKQHLAVVEESNADDFVQRVNDLVGEGYKIKTTHIMGQYVGTYDEYSIYQAVLVKEEDAASGE
jgi:hypothetical protein